MAGTPWHAQARAWVDAADPGEQQGFDDLQRVMHRLWIARLGDEAQQLAASGAEGPEDMVRLRLLHEQIARLKAGLAAPAG
jgi:DNA primase